MSNTIAHKATTALIFCVDDRLKGAYEQWRQRVAGSDAYDVRWVGAGLDFVKDDTRDIMLAGLAKLKGLGVTKVVVIDHLDCGGAKADYEASGHDEITFHAGVLRQAQANIEALGFEVETYLVDLTGNEVALPELTTV